MQPSTVVLGVSAGPCCKKCAWDTFDRRDFSCNIEVRYSAILYALIYVIYCLMLFDVICPWEFGLQFNIWCHISMHKIGRFTGHHHHELGFEGRLAGGPSTVPRFGRIQRSHWCDPREHPDVSGVAREHESFETLGINWQLFYQRSAGFSVDKWQEDSIRPDVADLPTDHQYRLWRCHQDM